MGDPSDIAEDPSSSSGRAGGLAPRRQSWLVRPVLYPNAYVWYILMATLDVTLTCAIMAAGGHELNTLADRVIHRWGLPGLLVFRFSLVLLVVCICEVVGRRNDRTGRKLAEWAVAITAIPVVISLVQLLVLTHVIGLHQPAPP